MTDDEHRAYSERIEFERTEELVRAAKLLADRASECLGIDQGNRHSLRASANAARCWMDAAVAVLTRI
jgi:hypothetical protein